MIRRVPIIKIIEQESNKLFADRIIQEIGLSKLVINPPFETMTSKELDASFDLPYTRLPHPKYNKRGPIPAFEMIKFSINIHRGCFGGCSFCTISAHQGKFIASRSQESILNEVEKVANMHDFKGYISDIGGPSANMYQMKGKVQEICERPELQLQVTLKPGDFLFLNNLKMLHSRTSFEQEGLRLYYRVWLSVPWSIELPDAFKVLFGETAAGALRGGFKRQEMPSQPSN